MASKVVESRINYGIANILSSQLGIDARAERMSGKRRPDIRCYYKGLIVGIEASYDRQDAERDAKARVDQELVDIALALWIKERYPDVTESRLNSLIERSKFDIRIFVPVGSPSNVIKYVTSKLSTRVEPATDWMSDITIPDLKLILDHIAEYLIYEDQELEIINEIKRKISDFVNTASSLESKNTLQRKLYEILWRLYGMEAPGKDEFGEIIFGQTALSILLSSAFYEHIRNWHLELKPLTNFIKKDSINGLKSALEALSEIDYKEALRATLEMLNILPPQLNKRVYSIIELGVKIASNRALLKRDFAGRVYHEITGDIALRKGFATFYTEVPAAYLLAGLSSYALYDLDNIDVTKLGTDKATEILNKIEKIKVADLACGSGTLLTASYTALTRLATELVYYNYLNNDLKEVGRKLVEEGIYGIDALKHASQITAINLALVSPGNIKRENIYTIYLGYIKEKGPWLGSLELLSNSKRVGGLLSYIEGGLKGAVESVTIENAEGTFEMPKEYDLIIMNPPFTRATGRTNRKFAGKKKGLFGFVADEKIRERLVKHYDNIRKKIRDDLKHINESSLTGSLKDVPEYVKDIFTGSAEGLDSYLDIGQAGEGLPFLYLAYKYVKNNGVIAFVLPRNFLAGVSWFQVRMLLASKFHLKYVIVSSDKKNGYNFSEGASLSEVLLIAKKSEAHTDDEETVFINLIRKPRTALEATILVERIRSGLRNNDTYIELGENRGAALVTKVKRKKLLEHADNWNRFVAIPDQYILDIILELFSSGRIILEEENDQIDIPMTRLNSIIKTIGIDRRQFRDNFEITSIDTGYPILYGGKEKVREKIITTPNAYAIAKSDGSRNLYHKFSGKILLPDRIRWNTAHAVVLYSSTPVLSNIFYTVNLDVDKDILELTEKSMVIWFNTTWGLLTLLLSRQETEGAFSSIKMSQWRLIPILDVTKLDIKVLKSLSALFDEYAHKRLRRIPKQFEPNNPDPIRLNIDMGFLRSFKPTLSENDIKEQLVNLYQNIKVAFDLWL